jgi:diadenosine tetraphosphate (Ap4A) HIT family hydrolase
MKIIGVFGIPGAGKTIFSKHLSRILADNGESVINKQEITQLGNVAYLNIDSMKEDVGIKNKFNKIYENIFGNVLLDSPDFLNDIDNRILFNKKRIPIMEQRLMRHIKKCRAMGIKFLVVDGVNLPLFKLYPDFDYKIRIIPDKITAHHKFLKKRMKSDGHRNIYGKIRSIISMYNKMNFDAVCVDKTVKNRYDRSLQIEALFIADIIKYGKNFKRLEVFQAKTKCKTDCSICNNLLSKPSINHEKILFESKYFFAKPVMHCFGGGHIIICPRECVCHISDLDNAQARELENLLCHIKSYNKIHGKSSLIWFHNEPKLNFKNSTKHLHIHVIPETYVLNKQNIAEMQLRKIGKFTRLRRTNNTKSVFYVCDSNDMQYAVTDEYKMAFFREILSQIYKTTFFKWENKLKNDQHINQTIEHYKDFDFAC